MAPRQSGKSRSLAATALWWAYGRPGQRVLVVSAGEDASRRLLAQAASIAITSPLLSGSVTDETSGLLILSNQSEIRSVPASERAVRGWSTDPLLIDEAAQVDDELLFGAAIPTTQEPYKPSTVRSYETALRLRILPELGRLPLSKVTHDHIKRLVAGWRAEKLCAKTTANQLNPLQVIYRNAIEDGHVANDPTSRIKVAVKRGRRERVADPAVAVRLLDALAAFERALWATAMYAGLRYGELRALRWSCVNFAEGWIDVRCSWDQKAGPIDVKTDAGNRKVPIVGVLRRILVEHKLATGRGDDALIFGRTADLVFTHSTVYKRALKAWKAAKLDPIGLHESRHTFASTMVDAGANIKQISTYMGHTDVRTTMNIYAHLFEQDGDRFTESMDAYLASAQGAS